MNIIQFVEFDWCYEQSFVECLSMFYTLTSEICIFVYTKISDLKKKSSNEIINKRKTKIFLILLDFLVSSKVFSF